MSKNRFKKVITPGGISGERAVILKGKACVKAQKKKFNVSTFDPKYKSLTLQIKQKLM